MASREKDVVYVPRVDASGAVVLDDEEEQVAATAPKKERKAKRPIPEAEEAADGAAEGAEGDAEPAEPVEAAVKKKRGGRRKAAATADTAPLSKQQANQLRAWKKQGKALTAAQEARLAQVPPQNAVMRQWRAAQPAATHRRRFR